jgi:hypothetical protein
MGHSFAETLFTLYLKFKFNWASSFLFWGFLFLFCYLAPLVRAGILLLLLLLCFLDVGSCCIAQAGLKLVVLPASASQVLALQMCTSLGL